MSSRISEQVAIVWSGSADTVAAFMFATLDGAERIAALNGLARKEFSDAMQSWAHKTFSVAAGMELTVVDFDVVQPGAHRMLQHSRATLEIMAEVNRQYFGILDSQLGQFVERSSDVFSLSPFGLAVRSDMALAVASLLDTTRQAFGNLGVLSDQMTQCADTGLSSVLKSTGKHGSSAKKR